MITTYVVKKNYKRILTYLHTSVRRSSTAMALWQHTLFGSVQPKSIFFFNKYFHLSTWLANRHGILELLPVLTPVDHVVKLYALVGQISSLVGQLSHHF